MMDSSWYKQKILSDDDIKTLLSLWKNPEKCHQDFNLFNTYRVTMSNLEVNTVGAFKKLQEHTGGMTNLAQYMLEYTPGAFARIHSDDPDRSGRTIVTLLEDDDLVGGESLVYYN